MPDRHAAPGERRGGLRGSRTRAVRAGPGEKQHSHTFHRSNRMLDGQKVRSPLIGNTFLTPDG